MVDPHHSKRGYRGLGFDNELADWIGRFLDLQREGYVPASKIAERLNEMGIRTRTGSRWSQAKVRRMLLRAEDLGYPVVMWTRREAGRRRKLYKRVPSSIAHVLAIPSSRAERVVQAVPSGSSLAQLLKRKSS